MTKIKSAGLGIGRFIGRHKKLAIALAIVLVAVVAFFAWRSSVPAMGNLPGTINYVRTVTLSKGSLDESISASGTVASNDVSNVTTDLKYAVKEINVQVGDSVQEGDVICTLDTADLLKSIEKARESLSDTVASSKKSYTEAQESYDEALADVNEAYTAAQNKESSRNTAKSAFNTAKSSVASFQTAYDSANAAVLTAMQAEQNAQTAYSNAYDAAYAAALADWKAGNPDTEPDDAAMAVIKTNAEAAVSAQKKAWENAIDATKKANEALQPAQSNLNAAKNSVNYTALESAYNSAESAYEQAKSTYEQKVKTAESAEKTRDNAKENYNKAGDSDQLESLLEELEKCTLKAETSGKVTGINATVGSAVTGNVATIQNTGSLKIGISIAEYDIEKVKTGMKAIITSDVIDGEVEGVLTQISPTATGDGSSSSSFAAEVTVNGADTGLLIGTKAKVKIIISTTNDVYSVPLDAIGEDEDGNSVVYLQTGTDEAGEMVFEPVKVTVGTQNDYYAEISGADLAEGAVIRAAANADEASEELDMGGMMGGMSGGMMMSDAGGQVTVVQGADGAGGMGGGGQRPSGGGMMGG